MRFCGLVVLIVAGLIASAAPALADKRIALVVGNSHYRHVPSLPNPTGDATAIAALLRDAGFEVEARQDLGVADLRQAVRHFAGLAHDADIAVVYYAGHGIEVGGTNFLIPVDARLRTDFDVEDETVSLDRVLAALDPAKKLRLVILDACRDNPFLKSIKRTVATRSISRGLAKVEPSTTDTLIAFAARAGAVAEDGHGKNSPFTAALLKHLVAPGLDLRLAFGRVRDDVMTATRRQQEPFVYGSLGGAIVSLMPADGATVPQQQQAALAPAPPPRSTGGGATWRDSQADPSFAQLRGKSFLIDFWENQEEISPRKQTWRVRRSLTVFANSEQDIQTRMIFVANDPKNNNAALSTAALGPSSEDLQWQLSNGNLVGSWRRRGFVYKFEVRASGASCDAAVSYAFSPGKTSFELIRRINQEKMNVRSMSADRIICRVVQGDAILNSPTAGR